jgi:histidinol-phosphate phosphatase family protein
VAGDGPLLDIGTPESYRSAPGVLARIGAGRRVERRRFVLLDRDGTLIEERHYLSDPGGVVLTAGAGQALRRLVGRGLGLVVVTNQSAVGRGFFDFARLDAIHEALANRLAEEGIALDGVFACPHRPEDDCACRKPRTALVERASAELAFDPAEAFVVGDKASDLELGRRLGARTILVRTGYGRETEAAGGSPDHVADDLRGAADFIEAVLDHDTRETRGTRATETPGTTKAADAGDLAEVRREKR